LTRDMLEQRQMRLEQAQQIDRLIAKNKEVWEAYQVQLQLNAQLTVQNIQYKQDILQQQQLIDRLAAMNKEAQLEMEAMRHKLSLVDTILHTAEQVRLV